MILPWDFSHINRSNVTITCNAGAHLSCQWILYCQTLGVGPVAWVLNGVSLAQFSSSPLEWARVSSSCAEGVFIASLLERRRVRIIFSAFLLLIPLLRWLTCFSYWFVSGAFSCSLFIYFIHLFYLLQGVGLVSGPPSAVLRADSWLCGLLGDARDCIRVCHMQGEYPLCCPLAPVALLRRSIEMRLVVISR